MKKLLLSVVTVLAGAASFAQMDTLTMHFTGNPSLYVPDQVAPQDSGYISGNNAFGDLAKMQLFDAAHGVSNGGTINGVLLGVPVKVNGGGSYQVAIWGDNAGQPANPLSPLAIMNVTLAATDTSVAGFNIANGTVFYNVAVNFATPVAMPAGNKFWAGVILPSTAGNSMALFSTAIGAFADADTHTGEFWDNGTFHTFGDPTNWDADIALAIFPVVNFVSTAGVSENVIEAAVFPNPATDVLNIKATEEIASLTITTMDGKVVAASETTNVSVADLQAGIYMYTATTITGKIAHGNFVKN